jgi:hypothetical protein
VVNIGGFGTLEHKCLGKFDMIVTASANEHEHLVTGGTIDGDSDGDSDGGDSVDTIVMWQGVADLLLLLACSFDWSRWSCPSALKTDALQKPAPFTTTANAIAQQSMPLAIMAAARRKHCGEKYWSRWWTGNSWALLIDWDWNFSFSLGSKWHNLSVELILIITKCWRKHEPHANATTGDSAY